ncbi:MAG: Uma2 family endonuclease [Methylococcales bacterium]|nr:Uma2 family endonuclease [Methylococcales bacterium]
MALQPKFEAAGISMTEPDYLKAELTAEVRHEYLDGRAYAMTGGTTNHIRITANVLREFGNSLKGKPCEAFMTDMQVKLGKDYVYPDVVVACNHTEEQGVTSAPVLIVEVLSKSTRAIDLTTKLIKYINLPSLQEYVLIEQDFVSVHILRRRQHWQPVYYFLDHAVVFEAIDLTLSVAEIYDRVDNEDMQTFKLAPLT